MTKFLVTFCSIILIGLATSPVAAHKLSIFATTDGKTITGYAYSAGGNRITEHPIRIESTEGKTLATLTTDKQGNFQYLPTATIDHKFILETTDGHAAQFTIKADEIQGNFTASSFPMPSPKITNDNIKNTAATTPPPQNPALITQVQHLREDIQALRDQTRLRDIIGGIGYLIGIAGIAFYFLGTTKNHPDKTNNTGNPDN